MTTQGPAPAGGRAPASRPPSSGHQGFFTPRRVVALVLLVLVVVFIVENRDLTEIRLLIPVVVMPLWAALVIRLIIGLVVGMIVGRQRRSQHGGRAVCRCWRSGRPSSWRCSTPP